MLHTSLNNCILDVILQSNILAAHCIDAFSPCKFQEESRTCCYSFPLIILSDLMILINELYVLRDCLMVFFFFFVRSSKAMRFPVESYVAFLFLNLLPSPY